ncbi:MAG: type II toxin-antitoxin system Phd/YefM family antitoxin [Acidobacteria bacterium]|nr:MAG: type II toxin-antitoxin system Phd/YefM family antitoxin [Acidobacteriota bacterium]
MKTIKASEFKAKCLKLMDEVAETGEPIIITKNGKPVSQLTPYREKRNSAFGALKGSVIIKGEIISPVDVEWEANR